MGTVITLIILAAALAFAVLRLIGNKKSGKNFCGGSIGCGGCPMNGNCGTAGNMIAGGDGRNVNENQSAGGSIGGKKE